MLTPWKKSCDKPRQCIKKQRHYLGHYFGVSASTSVLPMKIQDWFPLVWTGWISLQSKGLSSLLEHHISKASVLQCSALFMVQFSHACMTTGKTIALTIQTFVNKTLLAFALLHFVLQGQTFLLSQVSLDFLLLHSSLLWWKGHLFKRGLEEHVRTP